MLPARILLKDLVELAQSRVLLMLVIVVPLLLVLLIGNVRVREPVLRVAVYTGGTAEAKAGGANRKLEQLRGLLDELSNVSVTEWTGETPDLLERSKRERIDLLANWENGWHFYTPQTHPYRLQYIATAAQGIVVSIERARRAKEDTAKLDKIASLIEKSSGKQGGEPPEEGTPREAQAEALRLVREMKDGEEKSTAIPVPVIAAALYNEVTRYFPPVSQADRSAVPGLIALIAVFTPFLLASAAFVRERETGMLEVLVLAGRRRWPALVAGKLLLPLLVAAISLLLQLVLARSFFAFGLKPGLAGMLALQFLAALGSGLLGLSVSAIVRSQQQAYLVSAVYLLCLMLVTGYVYPLEQAGAVVRFASHALPLTFSGPAFEGWLTQGAGLALFPAEAMWLAGQCALAALLCMAALRRFERTL